MKNEKLISIQSNDENEIERVYTLGDSEMITNQLIESIILRTFQVSYVNYIQKYKRNSCMEFTLKLLHKFDCMADIKCDTQETIQNYYIQECERSRIDTWASNKTRINSTILEIEESPHQYISTAAFKSIRLKKQGGDNIKSKQLKDNKDKAIKELLNEEESESVESEINKILAKAIDKKKLEKEVFISNQKKEIDNEPQIDLDNEMNYYKNLKNLNSSFNEEKENKLRTLFKDKEKDKALKQKKIKEDEEKFIEIEKKKKMFLNNNNIIHINSLGKIVKVKSVDPDQLQDTLLKTNYNFTGIGKGLIKKKPVKLKNNKQTTTTKEGEDDDDDNNKMNLIKIETTEVPIQPAPIIYNQPDPFISISPEMGVKLCIEGKNKNGSDYNIENRMNLKDYEKIQTDIIPKKHIEKKKSMVKLHSLVNITEELLGKELKESDSLKRNINMFKEDSSLKSKNEEIRNNNSNLLKSILMESQEKIKDNLKELRKSKSTWNMKNDKLSGQIRAEKTFNYHNLPFLNDYRIQDNLNPLVLNIDINKTNNLFLPKNKHGNIVEEMGKRKKYPRERTSQEILSIKGKCSTIDNAENKYKNKENDRILNK